jgi:acyl-CoA dehydrogenase-like protein
MRFAFTDEQELLRREAREALSANGDRAPDFAALGWTAEDLREAGLGFVDEAVLLEELGRAGHGAAFFDAVLASRSRVEQLAAVSLEAVGIAAKALELGVEHAKTREQFGRKIGVYQAVSHPLSDTYVETELARSLGYWAAWCVAEDDEQAPLAAAAAKAYAGETAVTACERSIQVHGGMGFTWEHVLHRYYKRALWIEAFGGYGRVHRARVAAHLLD